MALVRVYCGLASADPADRPASAGSTLTSAVVDDAGRLLHVCEISDDPAGYAQLVALLVERSGGPSGAAIAADSDDHMVTSLLSAAGRPLAIADDDSVDDFAERFADDDSLEEMQSPPAERRAVGLARALQAGALSAVTLPAPRDLAGYKQVLAAHAALASGRHSAAVALREVLRELYPAALRAYPDPAEPVSLAVLDALPEPGMLGGTVARGREASVAADAVAAHLAADGRRRAPTRSTTRSPPCGSPSPRRPAAAAVNRALTSAVAETVRQAVAAVRACDAGCEALVGALGARVTAPGPGARPPGRRPPGRAGRRTRRSDAAPAGDRPARRVRPAPSREPAPGRPQPSADAAVPSRSPARAAAAPAARPAAGRSRSGRAAAGRTGPGHPGAASGPPSPRRPHAAEPGSPCRAGWTRRPTVRSPRRPRRRPGSPRSPRHSAATCPRPRPASRSGPR